MVNYRYTKGVSTVITTNKGIASWPGVLAGDEILAGAILDRLLHNTTVLNIQGRSYRLRDLETKLSRSQGTTADNSSSLTATSAELPMSSPDSGLGEVEVQS